jgi:hypothetical protein
MCANTILYVPEKKKMAVTHDENLPLASIKLEKFFCFFFSLKVPTNHVSNKSE